MFDCGIFFNRSMAESQHYIFTFKNTYAVMKAEKALITAGFPVDPIPSPREINSECGFSLVMKIRSSHLGGCREMGQPERVYRVFFSENGEKSYQQELKNQQDE